MSLGLECGSVSLKVAERDRIINGGTVRSGPSLGKCWAKIRLTSTFDFRLLGLWGVMNIINGISRGVSPCVRAPPSLATDERMLWERSTYESGVR